MVIENRDGLTILYAEGTNKITDKNRTLYSNIIYLGKNDSVDNYEEVSKDIWKNFVKVTDEDLEDTKENLKTLEEKVENDKLELQEENMMQDELILTSMDALAENYELSLVLQDENLIQDELILSSMDALAETYEQTLIVEESMVINEENVLISMDALAELYEMILALQSKVEILEGGATNGDSDGDNIL